MIRFSLEVLDLPVEKNGKVLFRWFRFELDRGVAKSTYSVVEEIYMVIIANEEWIESKMRKANNELLVDDRKVIWLQEVVASEPPCRVCREPAQGWEVYYLQPGQHPIRLG